jgi:hypothetical protein
MPENGIQHACLGDEALVLCNPSHQRQASKKALAKSWKFLKTRRDIEKGTLLEWNHLKSANGLTSFSLSDAAVVFF